MNPTWMWLAAPPALPEGTVGYLARFRSTFSVDAPGVDAFPVRVMADGRYRLLVNGAVAGTGPLKPSGNTWFYDEIDLAEFLVPGENVIGVEVLAYPNARAGNVSVRRSNRPAVALEGPVPGGGDLREIARWTCAPAPGRRFLQGVETQFLGVQEQVDARLEPHGWLTPEFDASSWAPPVRARRPEPEPISAIAPRQIPQLTRVRTPLVRISRSRGADPGWSGLLDGRGVTVAPNEIVEVDFDVGVLTTAFLEVHVRAGMGATVEFTAAECYEDHPIEIPWVRRKGDRTDAVNGDLYGDVDTYRVGGVGTPNLPEVYSPFWFRTARFLRIAVTTGDEPLVIDTLTLATAHYPLDITGSFASSSGLDARLWETSVRTLQNCMHETFEDCPFYEQMQYAMDTRSQALFSLHLSDDDRLVRRAIDDFARSGDLNGLTESRSPSMYPQVIPGFSLFWIFMVGEHLDYRGDRRFASMYLDRIHAILGYFEAALAADGFIISPAETPLRAGSPEVWNFVDWTELWHDSRGVPDLGARGASTILTFQYVAALASAARTARECGRRESALEYRARADDVLRLLAASTAWDAVAGYFRDSDSGQPASQHAQVWAVLAGAVTGDEAADLLARAVRDPALAPCSYAMSHSLFDALRLAGVHDLVDWQPWSDMLDLNLTTWAEDAVSSRSDCHGWGSVPLQHFPRWVLGVEPLAPGFDKLSVAPAPSSLSFAEGTVPTPHGLISVRWDQVKEGTLSVIARVPLSIDFEVPVTASLDRVEVHETVRVFHFTVAVGVPRPSDAVFAQDASRWETP